MGKTACLSNESKDNNLWNAPKSDKSLWDHITEDMRLQPVQVGAA